MTSPLARKLAKRVKDRALGWSDPSGIHIAVPASLLQRLHAAVRGVPQKEWPEVARKLAEEWAKIPPSEDLRIKIAKGKAFVCPFCLTAQFHEQTASTLRCQNCGRKVPRAKARVLATVAYDLAYYGWSYHVAYVGKTNRGRSFKLPEPSQFLWSLGSFLALSVASGLAYDMIKNGAKLLYEKYKQRGARSAGGVISDSEAIRMLPELHQWAVQYVQKGSSGQRARRLHASSLHIDGLIKMSRHGMIDIEVTQTCVRISTSKRRKSRRTRIRTREAYETRPSLATSTSSSKPQRPVIESTSH